MDTEGALPGQPFSFTIDATGTGGLGDVIIDLVHDKQSVPFRMEDFGHMQYRVSFVPSESGKYRVYVYFNGSDVRGSPFSIRVGTQKGSRRSKESSLDRSKLSSLERRMNSLNVSIGIDRSSPVQQKSYSSPAYKLSNSSQHVREYSPPVRQTTSSAYKTSNNYSLENSNSTYQTSTSFNRTRSPNHSHSPVLRNIHSPSMVKDTKEMYSTTMYTHSRSPTVQSPSFTKESKDVYASSTINRSRSPNPSPTTHGPRYSPIIKESREIYSSGSLKRSRSPNRSPMAYSSATQSPINTSQFSPRNNDRDNGYNRKDSTDNGTIDTSSNVRVSSMIGGTSRRDSWDAIEKTKSLLSYGSLESLANLANNSAENANDSNLHFNNNYKNAQGYNLKNILHTHNSTANFMSTQKLSSTSEYSSTSQKYNNENHNTRVQTHGILKNKNNNYQKGMDTTDGVDERYINNGISSSSTQNRNHELMNGCALETLPIHKPTTFTINQNVDPSKVTVNITGKFPHHVAL